jgi:RNA polymerase sigma factor (sigma-70 family)
MKEESATIRFGGETGLGDVDLPESEIGVDPDDVPVPSFEEFYSLEHARLFGALCLVTGDRAEAEDVMQDAFVAIWERWSVVGGLESPTGYLYRTAMNGFRMRRRRAVMAAKRTVRRITRGDELAVFEARFDVDRAMADMSPRRRLAIVLTELLGFNSNEAAEIMGVKPATVRKLAEQGRTHIRETIGDDDG